MEHNLTLLLEIMHCAGNLQIRRLSASSIGCARINCRLFANENIDSEYNV